jgi:alpha-galactosidase
MMNKYLFRVVNRPLFALVIVMTAMVSAEAASKKPLKVFVLCGQSNMEGHAKLSSFDHIGMDPKTAPILNEMRAADGTPRVCDDVWISYFTGSGEGGEGHGKLTAGYGARKDPAVDGGKIGPEFTFGIYIQKLLDEPVLIIKTAWGGKSIHTDFRPPSAGPYVFRPEQLEKLKERGTDVKQVQADRAAATGHYYRLMLEHVQRVLKDPKRVCPAYDPAVGYELAGFVWFQGWNDMVAGDVYPTRGEPGGYDAYSEVLTHFIRDVRKDLSAPNMHFVIGVMGTGGPTTDYGPSQQRYKGVHQHFRDAMAAPANLPEFKGNVTAVLTENYWDAELDAALEKKQLVSTKERALREANKGYPKKAGTISPQAQKEELAKYRAEVLSAHDEKVLTGATNAAYHYLGSAKIISQIGKGFAEACAEGLKQAK